MTYLWGVCRVARWPWGPWSDEVFIFDRNDPRRDADNDPDRPVFLGNHQIEDPSRKAVTYAPYIVRRWTRWDASIRELTLVYILSTEDSTDCGGYDPQLMKTRLQCP
jgi:hypothetical protein